MTPDPFSDLLDTVTILSLSAKYQIAYLRYLGDERAVDELAIEFHEALLVARTEVNSGGLTAEDLEALYKLRNYLEGISDESNQSFWTLAAVESSPAWDAVRSLAQEALFVRQVSKRRRSKNLDT